MTDILSDDDMDEIIVRELGDDTTHAREFARAVERAVLSRLAAMGGELPPSTKHVTSWDGDSCDWVPIYAYTADQLRTERAKSLLAGIAQERARCVAVCEAEHLEGPADIEPYLAHERAIGHCIDAIRSGAPAPDEKEQTR
jgi:hypothetical protein